QSNSVLVDGLAPVATLITPPADGSYFTASDLTFDVEFDGNVNVAGTPVLPITIGSTTRNASYVSGNGTNTLTFRYTIQSADQDVDGITVDPATISGTGITDAAGNESDFSPAPAPSTAGVLVNPAVVIDPVITSADGDYEVGDIITLTANFSQSVNVLGTPSIGLTVGSTPRAALYTSGTGTTILTFEYQVQVGDLDDDGITLTSPINLNGGTIRDAAGNDAVLTFTPITNDVRIQTAELQNVDVSNGTYVAGDTIELTANFDSAVTVTGTPRIELTLDSGTVFADYASGSGTTALVFNYSVQAGDLDTDGIALTSPIDLNGGAIEDAGGNAAVPTFTPPTTTGVLVDAIVPVATLVTPPISKVYFTGENLDFDVEFDGNVNVAGTPVLPLTIGAATPNASYLSGSGTNTLTFRYTIQSADQDVDGITVVPATISGAGITDAAGNEADFSPAPAPSTAGVIVNPAVIDSVIPSADDDYELGDIITLTANFSQSVTVTGTPRIELTLDSGTVFADFASGSGTTALIFNYSVQAGDLDTDGITLTPAIDLNGATIRDVSLNDASLTFTPPLTTGVLVDGVAPVATAVTPPTSGFYITGDDLDFLVDFSDNVDVTGTPALPLTIGAATPNAFYVSGTGTTQLTFRYTILSTDQDTDGIAVDPTSITAGITDAAGNAADFSTVAPPVTTGVVINTPAITGITVSDGTYVSGDTVSFTVTFNQAVDVIGTPQIALSLDGSGSTVYADYASGTGTTTLVFNYSVQTGHLDTNGVTLNSPVILNGGTIRDAGLNNAILTFTPPTVANVLVDAVAPVATSITPPTDGSYITGESLDFDVIFDGNVTVTGTPEFPFTIGSTPRNASYVSGTGSNTITFRYIVQAADQDVDGIVVDPTNVTAGITDAAGNAAVFSSVPVPLTAGIVVNAAVIESVTPSANGDYEVGEKITLTAVFSQAVDVDTNAGTTIPSISLSIGTNSRSALYTGGTGTSILVFEYDVAIGDLDTDGIVVASLIAL
ncbi:hypothetical protein N9B71_07170, partial [Pirellulales bacterium]|nr:hypothetical protein [Pirellulales bacterium]